MVGDEDQSIYGWRGADIRNILDFERDYPNATVIRLEQNYRSTKNILDAASALVSNNKERKGKWLWTESQAGAAIGLYEAPNGENEALFIADTIEKTLARNPGERVAVLYRTNFQSRQIEEALRRYGRKYTVVGGFSFYQRAEIKDVLAYLKAILSPQDSVSLLRIVNTPARGIGKTTVEQIEQYALEHNLGVWGAIGRMLEEHVFPTRAEAALRAFYGMMRELAEFATGAPAPSIADVLGELLERTGYRKMLEADTTAQADSRIENLQELLNAAAEAAERGENATDFLDHAALVSDADAVDERAAVSLLTMHNAKGLEFPVVFIAGLEEGLFPHSRSFDSAAALEEERRLCYVGMTRSEKRLYLSWARFRRRFGAGQLEPSIPSRFLKEVPAGLIEKLRDDDDIAQVDLLSERHEVRETVKRNLYTGKTYNSLENIGQFFAERGIRPPSMTPRQPPPSGPAQAPAQRDMQAPPGAVRNTTTTTPYGAPTSTPRGASTSGPYAAPLSASRATPSGSARPADDRRGAPRRKFGAGATVRHPKYGRGTVLRREGEGDDAKLTVSFPGYGLKKLIEKYAGIKEE